MSRSNPAQPRRRRTSNRQLDDEAFKKRIHALPDCPKTELEAEWRRLWKSEVPQRASRAFLIRAVAYGLQAEAYGGLDAKTKRLLSKAAVASNNSARRTPTQLSQGTKLFREWHGENHEVLVLEKGFSWRGETFRSLTAIARAITGTNWNGWTFFGLKRPKARCANV